MTRGLEESRVLRGCERASGNLCDVVIDQPTRDKKRYVRDAGFSEIVPCLHANVRPGKFIFVARRARKRPRWIDGIVHP